jgi:hypothetical protein
MEINIKDKKAKVILGIFIFIFIALAISLFSFVNAVIVNYFNNSLSSETLLFGTSNQNNFRYVDIPRNANVTSASINLSGATTKGMINQTEVGDTGGSGKGGGFIGDDFYYVVRGAIQVANRTHSNIASYPFPINCGDDPYGSTTNGTSVIYSICQTVVAGWPTNYTIVWTNSTGGYIKSYNYSFPTDWARDMYYSNGELYVYTDPGIIYVINESNGEITRNITTASGGSGFEIIDGFIYLGKYSKTIAKYNGTTLLSTFMVSESSINGLAYNNNTNELWLISHTTTFSFCFPDYTLISSPEGNKKISEFSIGDRIFSYKDKQIIEDKVINVTKRDISNYKNKLYEICTDDICVNTTYNHLFWTSEGYKPAERLKVGDNLKDFSLNNKPITSYKEFKVYDIDVWDLDIQIGNTFFAEGFLVDENGKNENSNSVLNFVEVRL